jgi:[histone H3]-lysine9 N-trimethyltransferase SUV39H
MMNHADQKVYKLAYFAIRDIPAMKEITFDYSPETAHEEPWVPSAAEDDEGVVRCLCGEDSCRGRVWPKRQAVRRKGRGWTRT